MFYYEFKAWFKMQILKNDKNFSDNIIHFKNKLLGLEINYLLMHKSKNFYLLNQILRYPSTLKRIKYLMAFFLPKKIIFLLK